MVRKKRASNGTANLGFEQKLWLAADKLRSNMDPAEYKHVILGLIFLKYISDTFEDYRTFLANATANPESDYYVQDEEQRNSVIEDRDEYAAENVFWVPSEARWNELQKNAKQPTIGNIIDDAMEAIEKENPKVKGILPKNYARPDLNKMRLGELIDLIGNIPVGDKDGRSHDVLGRVYEYFLGRFASAEGKGGGEFYTPSCVVRTLVEMIEPYKGRVYDPCCGSGGMFVQSERFCEEHGGRRNDIAVYGQESNPTTWRLAMMNLAIRGIEANLGGQWADTFHNDCHPDLKADYILANPPFNMSDWGGERLKEDIRWKYGVPPKGNANFAWIEHIVHHLAPNGKAGFVLANGSLSSNQSREALIRKALIEHDLIDCVVYLPTQLFYTTQISVSLWFLARNKAAPHERKRPGETLFIYAYDLGYLIDRTHRGLLDEEIDQIAETYRAWRGVTSGMNYCDIPGFCQSVTKEEIDQHASALVPGRYVGFNRKEIEPPGISMLRTELAEIKNRLSASQEISRRALEILEELING